MPLDEWKRQYSNNETPVAMKWLWENIDDESYSFWKVEYKYNDELAKLFMTNNLVGGHFNRLERARKYAFGNLLTLGKDDDNMIWGYFMVRGKEIPEEVADAADFESFTWTAADHNDPATRAEIEDCFAWEGPTLPREIYDGRTFKPKYVVTSVTALGGLLFGYDIGIMSSILQMDGFNDYFDSPDALATGVIVSSLTIGCFLGSLLSGPLADRFSRKITIMLGALVCTVGSAIQFASISRIMLIAGRLTNGLAIGFLSSVVPMYQSETAPPGSRGRMVSMQQWAITWGIFLAFGIDYGCSYIPGPRQFRLPLGIQIVPSIILLVTMAFMPFSPRWLVAHGHSGDARQVLGRLRAYGHTSAPEVTEELRLIHQTVTFERATKVSSYWELLGRLNRRRTLLGCGIQFMQQFTGINTLMLYSPTIFRRIGMGSVQNIAMFQAINGLVNVTSTIPAILWIDRWGRRPTLLLGTVLIIVFYLVLALLLRSYDALANQTSNDSVVFNHGFRSLGIASICMVYLVVASFAFSWGPCGWLIPSEIFPTRLRAKANSVTTSTNWISNFVVTLTSPILLEIAGWRLFLAFSIIMAANLALIYLFLPETKNLTLEEMDTLFAGSVWAFRSASSARKEENLHSAVTTIATDTLAANASLDSYEMTATV
ncbi:hypothetical protein H4S07_002627 [Coemansia furcata]|uniref:Uncharacterized protein n=1 Tax=Coemansia furcata TaxID=417177 RepID=A0ACC1LJI9_9FUNG|nr:hypothetical protein H4S07_002627 [Coemansia furcata]